MNTSPIPPESDLLHWEDFPAGAVRDCGSTLVSREAVLDFARQFDPQPFHVDDEAAKNSLFGGLAASGWHTCSMAMRLMCDAYLLRSTSLGSPGIDELRWLQPVRPGDRLRAAVEVLAVKASQSKPDRGVITVQQALINQHGERVLTLIGRGMYRRRWAG